MKHIIRISLLAFVLSLGITFAQQGNLTDWIDNLNDETPFGYTINQKISIKEVTAQKVVIQSPIIMDDLGTKITKYTVMYSESTLDQMLNNTTLLNQAKEKTFDYTGSDATLTMELGLYDGLDPAKVYYVIVMPKDSAGVGGQISNEIRFKMSDMTSGEGVYTGSELIHAAAGANMALANITHTCTPDCTAPTKDSKKITLKRISVIGSDLLDIFLSNDGTTNFNRLTSVRMSDEQYEIATTKNGEHVFKFSPNNGGTEYTYTVNIAGINSSTPGTPATPGITKVPKTGPTENTIVAILITLGIYFAYRRLFRKN